MRRTPRHNIARRAGALQAGAALIALLGPAALPSALAPARCSAASERESSDDAVLDALYELMKLVCQVLHCDVTPDHSMSQDDAIAQCAVDQILSYSLDGIAHGLTDEQRNAGLSNIDDVRLLLDASPGVLSADLTSQYTTTLEAMRDDLSR